MKILPGWGYWVLMNKSASLTIAGDMINPVAVPPVKNITNGWNLIGYYGNRLYNGSKASSYNGPAGLGKTSSCMLGSIVNTAFGYPTWSSLETYWEPYNPNPWIYLNTTSRMDPGAGYWVFNSGTAIYTPSTTC